MNKKSLPILLICLFASLLPATAQITLDFSKDSPIRKLQIAEMAINNLYVDSVDEKKLVEDAIRGMLEKLDPHSSYSDPEEVKALTEPLQGNFEGIGVQFNMVDDTLLVIQPVSKGPSEKVGIMAGDRIVSVNDTAIAGVKMSREEIMRRLRGPKGTKVNLGIVRRGVAETLKFTVKRDKIPVKSVDAVYMIRPGIGYIRIGNFGATTYDEFMQGLQQLKSQGMTDLVLDLQDNGGGYLEAAVKIANEFLERKDLIVYMEGRQAPRADYNAQGNGSMRQGRVFVLVNEFTASAAEIVSGAIQDHDRGTIIGRRTFGKGLVQRPIPLPDNSMIRLTIAHYYTPSGRCIQKPYTPVYGGGGIMPDVFVPLDTLQYTKFHRQLVLKGIVINTDLRYIDNHRDQLKSLFPTFESFRDGFQVPQQLVDDVLKEGEKQNVKPKDDDELQKTLPYLKTQLKALIARDLFDMSEYFQIINETSDIVNKAIELTQAKE